MVRRIRAQEYNGNTFITSDKGILKVQNTTSPYILAGLPRGLDLTLALNGGSGFLKENYTVAYRVVWGIKDLNNNYVYGPPSSRFIIKQTAGAGTTRNVSIEFNVPDNITTSHFFQVYRSVQVDSTALASVITDPGDELYLAYERNPTATEVAVRKVSNVIDSQPEELLTSSTPLYTNATQEGILQENTQPPYSRDLCIYKDHMIYANTKVQQNLVINLIGTSATYDGSTITIAGTTYRAKTAPAAANDFKLETTLATPSMNIDATAKNLVLLINTLAANTRVYAYYISNFNQLPGKILIESRTMGDTSWTVTVSSGFEGAWEPQLPTVATTQFTSTDDDTANSIIISKQQQPEHVPYINQFFVGPKGESIERVIALRDSVIIFKPNSIWRLVGTSINNFQISLLDNTVSLVSRDSCATLNNVVYALTNQGIVSVSDNGVQIVGRNIESDILAAIRHMQAIGLIQEPVGIGHESDRVYCLSLIPFKDFGVTDNTTKLTYVYNAFSQAWTRWYVPANCFSVLGDRLFYGFNNNGGYVFEQRLGYADFNPNNIEGGPALQYCDSTIDVTVNVIDVANKKVTVTISDPVTDWSGSPNPYPAGISRGWYLYDEGLIGRAYVLEVNGNVLTLDTVENIVLKTYTGWRPIISNAMLAPRTYDQPFQLKQFTEAHFDMGVQRAYEFDVNFWNENDYTPQPTDTFFNATPVITDTISFDNRQSGTFDYYRPHFLRRTYVDKTKSVGTRLYLQIRNRFAASVFEINAVGLDVRPFKSNKVSQ